MSWHVLNTRPADRAMPLTHQLRQAGHQVSELALLTFEPCVLSLTDQQALQQIRLNSVVVVISPIAAQLGLAHLDALGVLVQALPIQWVAVGQATAAVLRQARLTPVVPTLENSEGVVALPEIEHLAAMQQAMIWRGEAGRELIQFRLQQRQIQLHNLELYRRIRPPQLDQQWKKLLQDRGWPEVVLISSAETWRHWQHLAGTDATRPWLLVLGGRLFEQLRLLSSQVIKLTDLQPLTIGQALQEIAI